MLPSARQRQQPSRQGQQPAAAHRRYSRGRSLRLPALNVSLRFVALGLDVPPTQVFPLSTCKQLHIIMPSTRCSSTTRYLYIRCHFVAAFARTANMAPISPPSPVPGAFVCRCSRTNTTTAVVHSMHSLDCIYACQMNDEGQVRTSYHDILLVCCCTAEGR